MAPTVQPPPSPSLGRCPRHSSFSSSDTLSNAFNATEVLMKGMLFKRGQGGWFHRKTWKVRHVVLTSSVLRYYELDVRKGELDLRDCSPSSIQALPRDATFTGTYGTLWRFAVQTPKRRMLFSAPSEMEMNEWVRHLHLALAIQRNDFSTIQRLSSIPTRYSVRVPTSPRGRKISIAGTPLPESPKAAQPDGSHAVVLRAYRKCTSDLEAFVHAVVRNPCDLIEVEF
ncbi:hypothetical protein H310_00199 [Aphanomyces invadans]|uniref:PH domain-containing protein n=1 Tax=Aphanomyces invadans TaxID=157072 RepID=A0A024UT42_9STRA|nr:hypothetical protein H310_00199 [Aphanomyces invadans]ETW09686.1 hypothetical protein H310_00199 [Aphanomyces invadans]RHY33587.1 hypothetical protein DYB32_001533 [Aphanomyces invadans]|eukprot:XP_008861097.1 hypothetical protein H310_00199 [Aphanomyces invadans]